jgi:hypothetical protein
MGHLNRLILNTDPNKNFEIDKRFLNFFGKVLLIIMVDKQACAVFWNTIMVTIALIFFFLQGIKSLAGWSFLFLAGAGFIIWYKVIMRR